MSICKWKVYCNDEEEYVYGYLSELSGNPVTCFNNNTHVIDTAKSKKIETVDNSYTKEIIKWKIYCDTEQTDVYGYLDSIVYPETCFNNLTHIISKRPIEIDRITNNTQQTNIIEEYKTDEPTDGRFRCDGFEISATNNTTTKKDFSWPYPIVALILRFSTEETHRGDYINCYGKPTTYLNNLSSDISSNTAILPVVSTTPFSVGMSVVITDSVNTESLGRITSINTQNSTITLPIATQFAYYKNAYISYFNPIGIVTASVIAGDVKITCNSTVIQNVKKGMVLYINNSVTEERLGEIFEIDELNSTVTIQNSPDNNYQIGSYLTVRLHMIKNYRIGSPTEHLIGSGKIGGSYIKKFHIISIEYTNNSANTTKDFNWYTEVLY